jgi:hypothetical protein
VSVLCGAIQPRSILLRGVRMRPEDRSISLFAADSIGECAVLLNPSNRQDGVTSRTCVAPPQVPSSYPGIPLISLVFPVPAASAPNVIHAVSNLDAGQEFRHLIAELPFDPHS